MKLLKILITIFLGLFLLSNSALAGELSEIIQEEKIEARDLGVVEPKILPTHPLYFLKTWQRTIRWLFTFNKIKKIETALKFANEKIIEAQKLAELKEDPKIIEKTLEDFEREMEKIFKSDGEELKKFSEKIIHQQILHQKILQKIENQVPSEVAEKIKEKRMNYLEKFSQLLQKIEEKDKIAEKIINEFEKIKGAKFKDFKHLEILDEMKIKFPQDIKQEIEQNRIKIAERLKERLEKMSPKEMEEFKEYLEKISGNKLKHLEILIDLQADEISEKLIESIEEIKEKKIEEMEKEKGISAPIVQAQIQKAENEVEKAKLTLREIPDDEYGGRAIKRLLALAIKHLEEAKKSFQNEKYGRAFGLAIASYREAINAQKLGENIERIKNSPEEWREKFQKIYPGIQPPKNIQNCKIPIKPECKEGEVWRIERNENGCLIFVCEKITERGREERPKICPMVWDPVCGKDGKTYSNECFAKMAGIEIEKKGECEKVEKLECETITSEIFPKKICKEDKDCPTPKCPNVQVKCINEKCEIMPKGFTPRKECENDSDCFHLICPQVIGMDTPICEGGKCICGSRLETR